MGEGERFKEMDNITERPAAVPEWAVIGRPDDRFKRKDCRVSDADSVSETKVNPVPRQPGWERMVVVAEEVIFAISGDTFHLSRQVFFVFRGEVFQLLKTGYSSWKVRP